MRIERVEDPAICLSDGGSDDDPPNIAASPFQQNSRDDGKVIRGIAAVAAGTNDSGRENLGAWLREDIVDLLAVGLSVAESRERADLLLAGCRTRKVSTKAVPEVSARNAGLASPTLKSPVTITGSPGKGRASIRSRSRATLFSREGCDS
jgi:hypothetical protein